MEISMRISCFLGRTNACLKVKGPFVGGKDLYGMVNTYWTKLQERMDDRGDTWEKIQLIWILPTK